MNEVISKRKAQPAARCSRGCCGQLNSIDRAPKANVGEINEVEAGWGKIKVQVDSGAIDTVAPKNVAKKFELKETPASRRGVGFVAANGSKIQNYGERKVTGYTDEGVPMSMRNDVCGRAQSVGLGT